MVEPGVVRVVVFLVAQTALHGGSVLLLALSRADLTAIAQGVNEPDYASFYFVVAVAIGLVVGLAVGSLSIACYAILHSLVKARKVPLIGAAGTAALVSLIGTMGLQWAILMLTPWFPAAVTSIGAALVCVVILRRPSRTRPVVEALP